ncbi:hypothetical protein GDO78_004390 [Eleutherodactylus coqui]|uniref:Uncharacterized protein n=1 Tax=Eleutherodactylus coqui TaxID=57060 RepID=A0A8J6K0A7_ELECQ|nr:hypothetical protein GDO78_004390 [Eleutherodactylus coqui]
MDVPTSPRHTRSTLIHCLPEKCPEGSKTMGVVGYENRRSPKCHPLIETQMNIKQMTSKK